MLKIKYLLLVTQSKKTDYNTKINEIEQKTSHQNHDKYITTPEFNKLTSENFAARLKQKNLPSKSDIANFVNKTDFNNKLKDVTANKNDLKNYQKRLSNINKRINKRFDK